MIGNITYRELQRMSIKDLNDRLNVNGGIVLITVDSQAKYTLSTYPSSSLPNSPDGRHHSK